MMNVLDAHGIEIEIGDCVERNNRKYAVVGLSECCGQNIVVLGELVGDKLAHPYCELASWVTKQ